MTVPRRILPASPPASPAVAEPFRGMPKAGPHGGWKQRPGGKAWPPPANAPGGGLD